MEHEYKFKRLFEYFVSHLKWVVNGDMSHPGYAEYIQPLARFKKSGQGYKGHSIQNQIQTMCEFDGDTICININSTNYKSRGNYLNWFYTWHNVRAE